MKRHRVELPKNCRLVIRSDGEFYVYVVDPAGIVAAVLLGPDASTARVFRVSESREARVVEVVVASADVNVYSELVPCGSHVEELDPTPVSVPLGYQQPLTLQEEMRRFIREEISRAAASGGAGTFEEEDDFDIEDEELPLSQYEMDVMQEEAPREWTKEPAPAKGPVVPPAKPTGSAEVVQPGAPNAGAE